MNTDIIINTGDQAKDDIIKCLTQLGDRSSELGYLAMASVLYTLSGCAVEGSESELSSITANYARLRLLMDAVKGDESIKETKKDISNENDQATTNN